MKHEIDEIAEFKKRFKKANKASLFLPIYFSIIFIVVIFSVTVDPDLEIWKVILVVVLSAFLSFVFGVSYYRDKKRERQISITLEKLGTDSANDIDDSVQLSIQEMEIINANVMSFYKSQIFFSAGYCVLALPILIFRYLGLPTWAFILSIILWVGYVLVAVSILVSKHKKLTIYLKSLKENNN